MGTLSTIIIISIIIVICVIGVTIIQRREQEKARIRQLISKYRYRANETADILSNFANIPIGNEARNLMLQYIHLNLAQASNLAPNDQNLQSQVESVKQQIASPPSAVDSRRINIPRDPTQLTHLISHLSKLGKYLMRFKAVKAMNAGQIDLAVSKLGLIISEAKISAYIYQGKIALAKQDYLRAQSLLEPAQKMLKRFSQKNSRFEVLLKEVLELLATIPKEPQASVLSEKLEAKDNKEEVPDVFGPKKKW